MNKNIQILLEALICIGILIILIFAGLSAYSGKNNDEVKEISRIENNILL